MPDPITGTCKADGCTTDVRIGNPDWLTAITNQEREDLRYCDDHFDQALEDQTIDLGIGTPHTKSEEFERQREERDFAEEL